MIDLMRKLKGQYGPEIKPGRTRLDMLCPPGLRELFVLASEVTRESLSGFIIHSAFLRARQVLYKDPKKVAEAEDELKGLPYCKYV